MCSIIRNNKTSKKKPGLSPELNCIIYQIKSFKQVVNPLHLKIFTSSISTSHMHHNSTNQYCNFPNNLTCIPSRRVLHKAWRIYILAGVLLHKIWPLILCEILGNFSEPWGASLRPLVNWNEKLREILREWLQDLGWSRWYCCINILVHCCIASSDYITHINVSSHIQTICLSQKSTCNHQQLLKQ